MSRVVMRVLDVVAAGAGLIMLSPLLAVVAAAIRLDSAGPVLFTQTRVGRHFRPFTIYKFRTMMDQAEKQGKQITARDDPRITRVGRWLRRFKLDELPQMLNVLKGEMSLVGPRPEVPKYVDMFRHEFAEILTVRPGITDLASIKYYDEAATLDRAADPEQAYITTVLPEKLVLGKQYVRNASITLNVKLILQTLLRIVN